MCVGLVCVQVCNCGSGTVSRCVTVGLVCVQVCNCGSGTVSRCVILGPVLCSGA